MGLSRIKLDSGGVLEVLKSAGVAKEVHVLASSVAGAAQSDAAVTRNEVPVKVDSYTTDRAAAAVTLAHVAGVPIEAKHGVLVRAAGSRGLTVRAPR